MPPDWRIAVHYYAGLPDPFTDKNLPFASKEINTALGNFDTLFETKYPDNFFEVINSLDNFVE